MAPEFAASHLEIVPIFISKHTTVDHDIHFLEEYTGMRGGRCFLEIFYQPDQGPEKLLFLDDQDCLFTELPDDKNTNAFGLRFASSFYVSARCLLVPATKNGEIVLAPANQYQIRFRFEVSEKNKWPICLHQVFGLDPSQWQPTDGFSHTPNVALWARGYHPLASIVSGANSATPFYRIRMEITTRKYEHEEATQNWQTVAWDLRIRCWWTDRAPQDTTILHTEEPSNLLGSSTSSIYRPSHSLPPSRPYAKRLRINTSVFSGKLVEPPVALGSVRKAQARRYRGNAQRRSKRLEARLPSADP